MSYLVILRHGESLWNHENRFTGFTDIDLSPKGIDEAKEAGRLMGHIRFDHVFTSTLKRAVHTAEITLVATGVNDHLRAGDSYAMTKHDDLRERDYGELTGLNKDETRKKFGEDQVQVWRRSYDVPPPGGESLKDVVARVKPYYEAKIKPLIDTGKNVLLVAHGNTLRAMLVVLGENTPDNINKAEVPTGVPFVFEFENGQKQAKYFLQDF